MAHDLAPPAYSAVVGRGDRQNTFELRSLSDPSGTIKRPPQYTRSQSVPERARLQHSPSREDTIDEDEVFERPNNPRREYSLKLNARPTRPRYDDRQRKSCEDLRPHAERHRRSPEDGLQRNRTYSAGYESLKSSSDSSHHSQGSNSNGSRSFHPYLSAEWQIQTGDPSSIEQDCSDTATSDPYSSYASTLEKDSIKADRLSVNNKDYQSGSSVPNGSTGKASYYKEKPKISGKPVNLVKPSIPVKPQSPVRSPISQPFGRTSPLESTGACALPDTKGGFVVGNIPPLKSDEVIPQYVFDYDPVKAAMHIQYSGEDPLKVYTQYQAPEPVKSRDGVLLDSVKLQRQHSDVGSDTGQSGTLRSTATSASNTTTNTNKSLTNYRRDYRAIGGLGETQSTGSSDDSVVKATTHSALETVEGIAKRNRQKRFLRSKINRLTCGVIQIIVACLLITAAVFHFMYKAQGWFLCAGFWAGTFAAVGGGFGVLTHINPKRNYVRGMIALTMLNICVIYLGLFCIGLSFGLVQVERNGVKTFIDALNFIYVGLSLVGIIASVLQMSPVETPRELQELQAAKSCVDWKRVRTKVPSVDVPSTSSGPEDGYRNYGFDSSGYGDTVTTV